MHFLPRKGTGYSHLPLASPTNHAIGGNGKFQSHIGSCLHLPHQVGPKRITGLILQDTCYHLDARTLQDCKTLAGNARIRILQPDDNARNARLDFLGLPINPMLDGRPVEEIYDRRGQELLSDASGTTPTTQPVR